MSTEGNKAIVRRFIEEVNNKGNLDAIDEFASPDMVDHTSRPEPSSPRMVMHRLDLPSSFPG